MLQLYWKNATDKIVGPTHGVTRDDLDTIEPAIRAAHATVVESCRSGELGYAGLPGNTEYIASVNKLVDKYRGNVTDLVILGIGGSALGNVAIQAALNPVTYNLMTDKKRPGPRLFVLDNVDPALVGDTLKFLGRRLKTTLINVISKSGETAETASQFMIFREALRKKLGPDFAKQIVATTDTEKGTLHEIAKADGYDMLAVPGDVGGRFSVLSPVGLFSAAMCGIDIEALLAGAAAMKERVEELGADWRSNPACVLTAIKHLMSTEKNKPMHVMMPYSNRLYLMADWYRQLWAESLGKRVDRDGNEVFTGPTPIKALGTTDQHSQVQLYREGPNDKLTIFLDVTKHPGKARVPDVFEDVPGLTYLRKTQLSKILLAEKRATEYAMAKSERPTLTIQFNSITPQSIGEFIYLYEFTTSLAGELLNINAYDQPAVELGKQATFALLGREGYEELAKEMKSFTRVDSRYLA
ncbi:MAG: glucose-6-phosphate isomerase [Phycisphaerales bacterium]|jgi:glucose-6-phosphate isomerase|nr:glucose-6-phosphate isomerase [Phycisphaerales bacterium]